MEYFLTLEMNESIIKDTDEFQMHYAKWKELTQKAIHTIMTSYKILEKAKNSTEVAGGQE